MKPVILLILFSIGLRASDPGAPMGHLGLRTNDVIAVVGGGSSVALARTGHLETVITAGHPGHRLRFRTLAWEGDTVFGQPREINYPALPNQIRDCGATVTLIDFGQSESFRGTAGLDAFRSSLHRLVEELRSLTPRLLLLTPLPPVGSSPASTEPYAEAVRAESAASGIPLLDLHRAALELPAVAPGDGHVEGRVPSPERLGRIILRAFSGREPGLRRLGIRADGSFADADWEALRQAVQDRNRHWKRFVRPTNWAFLGGDRTEQPSSRDHRDPSVRWFPEEMKQYFPLIEAADREIQARAAATAANWTAR
jgi:hypothetical protein